MDMTLGSRDLERRQLNWADVHKINYLRSYQTTKKHMTLGPRNFERRQINWNHVHRVL